MTKAYGVKEYNGKFVVTENGEPILLPKTDGQFIVTEFDSKEDAQKYLSWFFAIDLSIKNDIMAKKPTTMIKDNIIAAKAFIQVREELIELKSLVRQLLVMSGRVAGKNGS
jgi:hypothetical protein